MAFLGFLQNFDELHVVGRGMTFTPSRNGEGRVLTLCINSAVNHVDRPFVLACTNSESLAFIHREKLVQCEWLMLPRFPLIDGKPQEVMEWSDISLLRGKRNVCCIPVQGTHSRTTVSAVCHILQHAPHIKRVKFYGVCKGRQMNHRFGRGPPMSMESLREARDEIDERLKQFDVKHDFY